MEPTKEQLNIINHKTHAKINAVAGSGKTTTLTHYAKDKGDSVKILYLVFNRSAKLDAENKFRKRGVFNITIETAHSLAYAAIVRGRGYKVYNGDYKPSDLVNILEINIPDADKNTNFIIATHVNKYMSMYCNSGVIKVKDLNYFESIKNPKAKEFVDVYKNIIEEKFKLFWNMMDSKNIDITHDFYLKKYHLSKPILNYDYILFDEGQDSSGVMLEIFIRQNAIKVIVGDTHQQIYSWRYAINSLEKMNFETFELNSSFRFNNDIAKLANEILGYKRLLGVQDIPEIKGVGGGNESKTHAIIARSNLALLIKAIEYCGNGSDINSIYFEGNLSSYTYASEGTSLYDVLNLYLNKKEYIRDEFISGMENLKELEDFVESVEDHSLMMLIDIVKEYGSSIPNIINRIKQKNTNLKEEADIIFTTVHKSKGIEYDTVELANDFIDEKSFREKLENLSQENLLRITPFLIEEINLLYVALTRTKNKLFIPKRLVPQKFIPTGNVFVVNNFGDTKNEAKPWSDSEISSAIRMRNNNVRISQIAKVLKRSVRHVELKLNEILD